MPLLKDKYKDLEAELIPMIIDAIDTPNFIDEMTSSGVIKSTPVIRNYPNVSLCISGGISINCLKSEKDSWVKKITPAFMELFQSNDIPLVFGQKDYISVTSERGEESCSININVSLIVLDRLLESKSELYRNSGKRKALYEKKYPRGIEAELGYYLIQAIKNTIFEKPDEELKYPAAYIVEPNKAFCLVCEANGDNNVCHAFYDFHLLFEGLCKKHSIELLPESYKYATSKVVAGSNIIKYEFNISPADMENLLLLELPFYSEYRDSASINRLLDPSGADIKDGFVCLFPALSLSGEEYMPRQAGCNMCQIISVQLANYIKNYLLADTKVRKEDFFGHHKSKLTEDSLKVDSSDINAALAKCMGIDFLSHQTEDGIRTLKKSNTPVIQICDLDSDAMRIYQRHGVVTFSELGQLQSGEVPILDFLDKLIESLNDKISKTIIYEKSYPSQLNHEKIERAKQGILKINELKKAITQGPPTDNIGEYLPRKKRLGQ